jgi:hypothetical protein
MRGIKILFGTTALLAGLAMAPAAQAQIVVDIGIQPSCAYGYYGYAPYACAPYGYYGPGYFYNGIFLGMGPWGGWGYSHGWGSHRFVSEGGGSYHGGPGRVSYRTSSNQARGGGQGRGNAAVSHGGGKPSAGRSTEHATASHASAPHASAAHSGGGEHAGGGGGGHAGGERR